MKQASTKPFLKPVIYAFLFGLTVTLLSQSCGTIKASNTHVLQQPPVVFRIHDTITVQRKSMSSAEFQDFMKKQYQYNYEMLFMPEFRKITSENESLKNDLTILTGNLNSVVGLLTLSKHQKDSIERLESFYRNQNTVYQQENLRLRNEGVQSQRQSTAQIAKFMERTDRTIGALNSLTRKMLLTGVAFGLVFFAVSVAVFLLWKKVHLMRQQTYVK